MAQTGALRLGSLCTGYGGLDMAAQHVFGTSLAWVADNDPGASRILAHRYPGVPNLDDLTAVDWHAVEAVDILTGGYPCQPFSSAGKRKGTTDARHIWPHIAAALGVLRPRLALFENVAGHLSLGFDAVLADLAALGFDAEWRCVRASEVGAAHQRNRLFVLAWPADTGSPGLARRWAARATAHRRGPAADSLDLGEHRARARRPGRDEPAARRLPAADSAGRGFQGRPSGDGAEPSQQLTDADGPDLQRGAAAHPARVGEREPADQTHPLAGSRDTRQVPRGGGGEPADPAGVDFGAYGPAVARWESVLGRPAPRPVDALGRLNPPFVEWLMGLPPGHVTDVPALSRSAQLKALGNGVMPPQAIHALDLLLAAAPAGELTAAA